MTSGDLGPGRVTCLVCNASQSMAVARSGGACSICGSTEWDPPLDLPVEEAASETQEHSVPQPPPEPFTPFTPKPKRRFPVKAVVILAVIVALILGIRAVWPSGSPQANQSTRSSSPASTFKKGDWLLVLESLPKKSKSHKDAETLAKKLNKKSATRVVDSAQVSGLRNGYWVVVAKGAFSSRAAASKACAKFGRKAGSNCYPRQVT